MELPTNKILDKKYKVLNNTYIQDVKTDIADTISVEVGDIKQTDFKPQFKIMRWDNEVNFSIRAEEKPNATIKTVGDKIKYITDDYEVHQYDKPDASDEGGFEFEWVLPKKPKTNILTATIQTKELDFIYQPELTQEEIKEGCERPDNIIGSYAVYHKTKQGNYTGGKHYKTGKAFHIYRPEAIDAKGNRVWCDLNIDKDLTITIPQDFLDKATYPVIVDPTFGYDSAGGSLATGRISGYIFGHKFNVSESGTVSSISMYAKGSSDPRRSSFAIYDDSATKTRKAICDEVTYSDTASWQTGYLNTDGSFVSGDHWICNDMNISSTDTYYDSVTGFTCNFESAHTYNIWNSTATLTSNWDSDIKYSIYATYTTAGSTYTLTAETASFTLTGNATTLLKSSILTASQASFTLTGIDTTLQFTRKLLADTTSFTLTGADTAFQLTKKLLAQTASFALTGTDALFSRAYRIVSDTASFILDGKAVSIVYNNIQNHVLTADTGVFTLTGIQTLLKAFRTLTATSQSFTMDASDVLFLFTRKVTAITADFTLTAQGTLLKVSRYILASTADFTLTTTDTALAISRKLTSDTASFVFSGKSSIIKVSRKFTASVTTFTLTGISASIRKRVNSGLIIFGISL